MLGNLELSRGSTVFGFIFAYTLRICLEELRYTNAGLKISLYVCVHIKTIPGKLRILNPRNSGDIYL